MITATEFLKELYKNRMKEAIINRRFAKKYPVSQNTFAIYNREIRKTFATGACEGLITVVTGESEENLEKRFVILSYLITFLTEDDCINLKLEKRNLNATLICTNFELTKKIIKLVINKFSKNSSNINSKMIDKNLYIKSIINDHKKILIYLNKDTEVALVLIKKLLKTISRMVLILKNENYNIYKKYNILELALSKNIFPENIKNIINSLNILTKIDSYIISFCEISLKILIEEWFIKEFLKKDYSIKTLKNSSRISINKNTAVNENIKILEVFDLISLGWTLTDYAKVVHKFWEDTIDELNDEHIGELSEWIKQVTAHPENTRIILNTNNEFVGYWNFDPLVDEMYYKAKSGNLLEIDIKVEHIQHMIPGTYNIYFDSICIKPEYRGPSLLKKILDSILENFEELAKNDIFINEICSWAYTDSGKALCSGIGLNYIGKHIEIGHIYSGTIKDILKKPICDKYINLKKLYNTI